jgi:hypothetical protein
MPDFSHFGPFKKFISQIDSRKTYPINDPFWGARVTGAVVQPLWRRPPVTVAQANRRGRRRAPAWVAPPQGGGRQHPHPSPPFLFLYMELQLFYFCFIFSNVFSHLGSRYNQPQKKN